MKFFWGVPSKILDRHYKTGPSIDHGAKFHASRLAHHGDLALKKCCLCFFVAKHKQQTTLEIWGKAQRESARRPKSDWERNFEW